MIENIQKIADIIYEETGIYYGPEDLETLGEKIRDLVHEYRFMNSRDFIEDLKNTSSMKNALINASCSKMTRFFRNQKQLDFLASDFLKNCSNVNILSAGCSTGQEVYSTAMFLHDFYNVSGKKSSVSSGNYDIFKVYGCDVSLPAVEQSKAAVYTKEQISSLPEKFGCFTEKFGSRFKISDEIKKETSFFVQNIVNPLPEEYAEKFDGIFCRNVLIYFDEKARNSAIKNLFESLKSGGFLFLGNSETIPAFEGLVEKNFDDDFIYYVKK